MHVEYFEVQDLLGRPSTLQAQLNPDLNILTGKNGAGKTSLIKLIWYVMSGNIIHALHEVAFSRFRLVTSSYDVTLHRLSTNTCRVELIIGGKKYTFEDMADEDGDIYQNAEDQANARLVKFGSSVLFPTFRRIEGGFTLRSARNRSRNALVTFASRAKSDVEEALSELSNKLTNGKHTFVSSISTADVVGLLLTRYADLSQEYSSLQQRTSEEIIAQIKTHKADERGSDSDNVLDQVRNRIEDMEGMREKIMQPFDAVRGLVEQLFRHTGINFGARLNFGDAANAVNSDQLSAGEKQMLSFICYNAFNRDSTLLIDEPELSLHVDWQRQLFPILLRQQSNNQFIIATHSPFIYGKYPDKEVQVDLDRGDAGI